MKKYEFSQQTCVHLGWRLGDWWWSSWSEGVVGCFFATATATATK